MVDSSFSIEQTIDNFAQGSPELFADLQSPEELNPIEDNKSEAEPPKPKPEPSKPKEKPEETPVDKGNLLSSFMEKDEEDPLPEDEPAPEAVPTGDEPNIYNVFYKDLVKIGALNPTEEDPKDISSPEEFLEALNGEKKRGASEIIENFLSQFGEDYRQAFEAIYVKGVDPKSYWQTYGQAVEFSTLDLTREENQEKVIRQMLMDQDFETEDISEEIEKLKNYGDLEDKAKKYHKVLLKKEAQRLSQMEKEAEKRQQQILGQRQQYTQAVSSILQEKLKAKEFDSIPLNPKLAQELQDYLITEKYKNQQGETFTEFDRALQLLHRPENYAQKVKVALLLKTLEKDPTLQTIQRAGLTKRSDSLFENAEKLQKKPKTSNQSNWTF